MLEPISEEDYTYLKDKFGKLVYYSAQRISGDYSKDVDDYVQEIWFLILDYLPKYLKKHNTTVAGFCENPKTKNYIKQWIWTCKNHLGAKNTQRMEHFIGSIDMDRDDDSLSNTMFEVQTSNEEFIPAILAEMRAGSSVRDRVLSSIAFDLGTVKDTGSFNVKAISDMLKLPINLINREVDSIRKEYKHAIKDSRP